MLFVVVASALLATVLGADPTKVCLPETFQTLIFAFQYDVTGLAAFDFPNEVIAVRLTNGLRTVYNLTDLSAVSVNDTDGKCYQLASDPRFKTIGARCLPANAVKVGNVTTHIGIGTSETAFEGWEFEYPGVGTVTAAVTTTNPTVPILRQYISADGKVKDIVFFFNAQTSIDDKNIFNVPDNCEPPTVVG
ncbi:hypothetical protein BsWGS_04498 [Bradybaena similaris]